MTLPRFTAANALTAFGTIIIPEWILRPSFGQILLGPICSSPCPAGTQCTKDMGLYAQRYSSVWPPAICCAPGKEACNGTCYPPCPGKQRREEVNCTCYCPGFPHPNVYPTSQECVGTAILNEDTCLCECPPSACSDARMTSKLVSQQAEDGTILSSCACQCPPGLTDCYGYCADLTNDPLFCGSCDATPCDPFSEKCCNGTCTNICTDNSCGDCGVAVQSGEKCCDCTPTKLGTNANCSDCGDVCTGGRTCVDGSCQCPPDTNECGNFCCPNTRDCCNGICCPTGTKCCNGKCVNLNIDINNCGQCGNRCASGRTCVNGRCQCPLGTSECGSSCCPTGTTCCNGRCVNLQSDHQNCGTCGNTCLGGQHCDLATGICTPYTTQCQNGRCVCPTGLNLCGLNWCTPFPVCCTDGSSPYSCSSGSTCCQTGNGCCW